MSKLTKEQMLIAADMCDARQASMNSDSSADQIEAMSWLFENGIFFMGEEGCDLCAKMLREQAALQGESKPGARISRR